MVSPLAGTLLALTPGKEDGDFPETTLRPGENDEGTSSFSGGIVTVRAEYENDVLGEIAWIVVRSRVSECLRGGGIITGESELPEGEWSLTGGEDGGRDWIGSW